MNIAKKKNYQEEGSLRTEVLRGKEATSAICGDWDSLFERSLNAPPFLSSTWARVFIEENRLHGKPVYVLVWSNNKLVGLLPLAVRRFLTLKLAEPIGTGVSSYLGLLLDPNYPSAVRCIAESFKKYKVARLDDPRTYGYNYEQFVDKGSPYAYGKALTPSTTLDFLPQGYNYAFVERK